MNPDYPSRYSGIRAVITGASGGLGQALAVRLAGEGASLVLIDHPSRAVQLRHRLESLGPSNAPESPHEMMTCDVSIEAEVAAAFEALGRSGNPVHALFCLAGIQREGRSDLLSAEDIMRVLNVTFLGTLWCNLAAVRLFLAAGQSGTIVNCSSVHEIIPKPGLLSYALSKASVGMLTKTLALEYVRNGIRINAVGPGAVDTPINDTWRNDPARRATVEDRIPIGRVAQPEEIAAAFAFLGSSEASYFVGQTIFPCGGLTLYGDFRENWSS